MFATPAGSLVLGSSSYTVPKSLRFRSTASAALRRTWGTPTNNNKWTFSAWVKRGKLGSIQQIFHSQYTDGSQAYGDLRFDAANALYYVDGYSGTTEDIFTSAGVFRDIGAWYHIVLAIDFSKTVLADRIALYVNGVRQTGTYSGGLSAANQSAINAPLCNAGIGVNEFSNTVYLEGYMAEVYFIDGQFLPASAFAQASTLTGQWSPKAYTGTYGNNGFYLDFRNATSLTTLGQDRSGNGNNWTATNFSLTTGATYDSVTDTPSNNFPVLNLLREPDSGAHVFQDALLGCKFTGGTATTGCVSNAVIPSTGSWFWETTVTTLNQYVNIGIQLADEPFPYRSASSSYFPGVSATSWSINQDGQLLNNFNVTGTGVTITTALVTGDVIGQLFNADAGTLTMYKNGVSLGEVVTGLNSATYAGKMIPSFGANNNGVISVNFGQLPFQYAPAVTYKTLCTQNLPDPVIPNPKEYFDVKTYVGNGGGLQVGEIQKAIDLVSIGQSLRFNSADSSYLSRIMAAGDRRKFTWSGWVKRANLTSGNYLMFNAIGSTGSDYSGLRFITDDTLQVYESGGTAGAIKTMAKFRDLAKWYHVVYVFDSANVTAADRQQLWVDGIRQSVTGTPVAQNFDSCFNRALQHTVGMQAIYGSAAGGYFDGYMAEINFVDGLALDPSSFGQWDANGYWIPKTYAGTYGTNGFKLTFADSSGTTATTLGKDYSGNGNNWTPTGFSVTTGATMDVLSDSPTNNYPTLNGAQTNAGAISDGGLKFVSNSTYHFTNCTVPFPSSGKFYAEFIPQDTAGIIGVGEFTAPLVSAANLNGGFGWYGATLWTGNSTIVQSISSWVANDVIGVGFDASTNTMTLYRNGTLVCTQVLPSGKTYSFACGDYHSTAAATITANFGQRAFAYAPPAGFVALCENNIAEYTYDVEKPDLVWIKSRSAATSHMIFDSVRGPGKYLMPTTNTLEMTDANSLVQFNKNGFMLGNNANVNALNATYVAWLWKAGGGITVDNTDGNVAAKVSVNTQAGFSIAKFTNTSGSFTVGHGLGVTPSFVIMHALNTAGTYWPVLHASIGTSKYLDLATEATPAATTSSFSAQTVGFGTVWTPADRVMYSFAEVPGFSKFGSYTGNGSTDGPFVHCGFRPAFVMYKKISNQEAWYMFDSGRELVNDESLALQAESTLAETSFSTMDFTANGFKIRTTGTGTNSTKSIYIYAAFAENPFKYANAR